MPLVVRQLVGRFVFYADGSVSKVENVIQLPIIELDSDEVRGLASIKHDEAVFLVSAELEPVKKYRSILVYKGIFCTMLSNSPKTNPT